MIADESDKLVVTLLHKRVMHDMCRPRGGCFQDVSPPLMFPAQCLGKDMQKETRKEAVILLFLNSCREIPSIRVAKVANNPEFCLLLRRPCRKLASELALHKVRIKSHELSRGSAHSANAPDLRVRRSNASGMAAGWLELLM
ncbi:hypothetical protein EAG_07399 [Camponotus floridanus]|uniref:Uncharacterized protein n=1 Tax=Camponotus floridanus TaxID=104421 RepID=E2ASF5_CAMFO|nr:hypothetical protein EAG_07399 [Camponotus floridanus]